MSADVLKSPLCCATLLAMELVVAKPAAHLSV